MYASQGPLCCRCLDISPTGMSLVSPQAVKPRQRVRIESSFKGQRLVLEAVVIRRSRSREGHVLGLRFEGLDPRARVQLGEVLRSMQVQAALAMQSCAFVERLPVLQLPEPEPEPRTEKSPVMERAPAPMVAVPPPAVTGRTLAMPIVGGGQEQPWMGEPQPRAATPVLDGARAPVMASPRPRIAKTSGTQELPVMASPRPRIATPSPRSPGPRRVGLEVGWTEDELVTTHYRPPEPSASLVDAYELDGDGDVDVIEAPDAADCTEVETTAGTITVTEARVPDWEPGAPVALAELVDTDAGSRTVPPSDDALPELDLDHDLEHLPPPPPPAGLDRTMLTPRPALASFATTSPADDDDDANAWLGPARTGKTMVVHVQDLIAAYAPLVEPELDLPEPTAPMTAPTTMPRLSDELQAALDRLRRRDCAGPVTVPPEGAEAPAPRPTTGSRRRRPGATQAYATTRRDDTQVKALYHAALPNQGETKRGDGS